MFVRGSSVGGLRQGELGGGVQEVQQELWTYKFKIFAFPLWAHAYTHTDTQTHIGNFILDTHTD